MGNRLSFARRIGMVNHPDAPRGENVVPTAVSGGRFAAAGLRARQGLPRFVVDRFGFAQRISQVNLRDALRDEDDVPHAVLGGGSQSDALRRKGLGNLEVVSLEGEPSVLLHAALDVVGAIFGFMQASGPGARAGLIALRRHGVVERLMRSLRVVDDPPRVEDALPTGQVLVDLLHRLGVQRPVHPLVLALGLRMVRPGMSAAHAQAHQPDRQRRPTAAVGAVAPGRAVVHRHAFGQAITLERLGQPVLDRLRLLVRTGGDAQGVARMVVQHRQRMAAPSGSHRNVPFEIHLPEPVGTRMLEANESGVLGRLGGVEAAVAPQNLRDRRGRRQTHLAQILQSPTQFASAPRRMLASKRDDLGLHSLCRPLRTRKRPTRAIRKKRAFRLAASEPFVPRLPTDPEPTAKLGNVRTLSRTQAHEFSTQFHDGPRHPRHDAAPKPQSLWEMCYPSLRTPVTYLSGPYKDAGRGEYPGHARANHAPNARATRPIIATKAASDVSSAISSTTSIHRFSMNPS